MGSSYFYLEFLLAFVCLLRGSGFSNPAVLALEYTLVPDASYPVQLHQALAGYRYILSIIQDPSKICVSGDSAGGTIILSLLLHLAQLSQQNIKSSGNVNGIEVGEAGGQSILPGMAALISPWVTLVSPLDKNTASDYLDSFSLHQYAKQYAGSKFSVSDPFISPGKCKDVALWRKAAPSKGFFVTFGKEEVFAPEIRGLIALLKGAGIEVHTQDQVGGIHAWPVASLFLSSTMQERRKGLKAIVERIWDRMT